MLKEHLEFLKIDLSSGWETPPGYPENVQQKILDGSLNEKNKKGSRTRLLRFAPGAFTTVPFEHEYGEEVLLISGTLTVGGKDFKPFTYACRPPHRSAWPFQQQGRISSLRNPLLRPRGQRVQYPVDQTPVVAARQSVSQTSEGWMRQRTRAG